MVPERVEQLIISLYQPNPPEVIASTQAALARIQSLPQAWTLSKELLSRRDEKVQFFGVLTIIIKLNTQSASISDEEAIELLICLIGWYVNLIRQAESRLVTRKLVSALSTFFLRYHTIWPRFLDHIGVCLANNQVCYPDTVEPSLQMCHMIEMLGQRQMQALLWVATHVVEDVLRLDPNSAKNASSYKAVLDSTPSFKTILSRSLQSKGVPASILEDAIKCLQAWVTFTQKAPTHETDVVGLVKPLLGNVIELLTVGTVYDASVELLIEALSNNPSLFTPETNEVLEILLKSPWAAEYYQRMTDGDFTFDSIQFAQLLLAFAEARMPLLIQNCHADSSEILSHLCDLLLAQGYPVVEDRIFVPLVEFWSSFAETIPDHLSVDDSEEEPWKAPAYMLLMKACSNAWQKITYPPSAAVADWDSNDRAGFADSRKDVVDLLQSVYALVGPQLLGRFAATVLLSLKDAAWLRLEAAVYCLGGLADCCQVDDRLQGKNSQQGILSAVLSWVIGLLRQFPYDNTGAAVGASQIDISAEPEVAQNAMEISSRILTKDPSVILHIQPAEMAEFFFFFALQALDGNEPLPKAAAAEFWATFVNVRSSDESFQNAMSGAMDTLGPLLCQSLARNIGGNASRSELDKLIYAALAPPIKWFATFGSQLEERTSHMQHEAMHGFVRTLACILPAFSGNMIKELRVLQQLLVASSDAIHTFDNSLRNGRLQFPRADEVCG
ncbi:hypothetical protein ARSEF1564_008016 [Beauveria bassiana]